MIDRTREDILQDDRIAGEGAKQEGAASRLKKLEARMAAVEAQQQEAPSAPTPVANDLQAQLDELKPLRSLIEHINAIKNHFRHATYTH